MIKLVLSTPRSGSNAFSESLKLSVTDVMLHETMLHIKLNHYKLPGKSYHEIVHHYVDGSYYLLPVNNVVVSLYNSRNMSPEDEFLIWMDYLCSTTHTVILSEHLMHLPNHWINKLLNAADEFFYIYRKNINEQLASMAIAKYTGAYIFTNSMTYVNSPKNLHMSTLEKFDRSILVTDESLSLLSEIYRAEKTINAIKIEFNVLTIEYEELNLSDSKFKKNYPSSYGRLCNDRIVTQD